MRAIVIEKAGGPEVLGEAERLRPEPGPGEILVRVRASALNRADLLQRMGRYPPPEDAPQDIPGLEYVGEVEAAGPGAGLWAVGNRVMGLVQGGGHAEYVVVHEREAVRVPKNLGWEEAAAVPEAFMTAFDALFVRLDLKVGECLLIHAVGSGVGTAAVQLAHAAGATVIGTSRTAEKLERAEELGLDLGIHVEDGSFARQVEEGCADGGVHAILDLVGAAYYPENVEILTVGGRIVVVGTVSGQRVEMDLGALMRRRIQLTGTVLRSRALEEKIALATEFSKRVLPLISSGRIRPVVDRVFPFTDIREAHRYMESNRSFGKIVLRW